MDDQTPSPEKSITPSDTKLHISWSDSYTKSYIAIEALSSILPSIPHSLSASETPASTLLHDPDFAAQVSQMLRRHDSGAIDDNLCRWIYDTFQTFEPDLHLVILRFLPLIIGVYLSRATLHKPLAGFESILLAIYGHETTARNGQAGSVSIPDLSHSSIYHETKQTPKNGATELHIAVISPSLEPYGTVRSTRRARIVAVALEMYYRKISQMPIGSKIEFCEFCKIWSGQESVLTGSDPGIEEEESEYSERNTKCGRRKGRVDLPWELIQPILRILGHCLNGPREDKGLFGAALDACRCLYARSLHDINPKAILATQSLLKLAEMSGVSSDECDYTEITVSNLIKL